MITPLDIENKTFSKQIVNGYSTQEVHEFMSELLKDYERIYKENIEYKDKVAVLNQGIQHYKSIEDTLQNALVVAQGTAETVKQNAKVEADNILKEAELNAMKSVDEISQRVLEKQSANNKRHKRNRLMAEAREGNEEAIESLTLEDMDTYSMISKRITKEDVFSIVNSSFMPYGIESDQYSVLGEIIEIEEDINSLTKEKIYSMKVECNDIIFNIAINEKDLLGEPAVGRRFKGSIWMQGTVCL